MENNYFGFPCGINSSGDFAIYEFGKMNALMRSDCDKNITCLDPRITLEKNVETGKWKASIPGKNLHYEAETSYSAAIEVSKIFNDSLKDKSPTSSRLPFTKS